MWLESLSTKGEPVHYQGKVELSSKNAFTLRLVTNLLKVKNLDTMNHGGSIKMGRCVWKICFNQSIMQKTR